MNSLNGQQFTLISAFFGSFLESANFLNTYAIVILIGVTLIEGGVHIVGTFNPTLNNCSFLY